MLIVLSGMETIHKKFFARRILATINPPIQMDGYTINLTNDPYEIFDSEGVRVYGPQVGDLAPTSAILSTVEGAAFLDKVDAFFRTVMLNSVRDNHFSNVFEDIHYDVGLNPTFASLQDGFDSDGKLVQPHSYRDVIANYQNRLLEHHVITGVFSYEFIKKIRRSLGKDEVIVLNITRNPSTCFLLNRKDDEYYTLLKPNKNRTPLMDKIKLEKSTINACLLKRRNDITHLKFEDIITNGGFTLLDKFVTVPHGYDNYNGLLTQWEYDNLIPLGIETPDTVDQYNEEQVDYHIKAYLNFIGEDEQGNPTPVEEYRRIIDVPETWERGMGVAITSTSFDKVPKNVFTELGYQPLTYNDIVKPNDTQSQAV